MPFAFGVEPVKEVLQARRGKTFRSVFRIYSDKEKTVRLNLTGLTVKLVIVGYKALTEGQGLTVNKTAGEISVFLSPTDTQNAPADQLDWYLELEETPEETVEPLDGIFYFTAP